MQKTLVLSFEPSPKVERDRKLAVLTTAISNLRRRTLNCVIEDRKIIAKHVCTGWNRPHYGSCPENSFWNIDLGEEVRFTNITAEYNGARLPHPEPDWENWFQWRNGECFWSGGGPNSANIYTATVTCLPSRELVQVSLDVKFSPEYEVMNSQRVALLNILWDIELRLRLALTTQRLIKAYNSNPPNAGRIKRFEGKLLMEIGGRK